jgi:hypothetical protein
MSLTIEDGTGIATADSYATLVQIRAYAVARGVSLPAAGTGLDPVEVLAREAMGYIEAQRGRYQGTKGTKAQALAWPRGGVVVDGFDVDPDEIPACLVAAQCQLVCDAFALGGDLLPLGDGREIIREKLEGVSETEYAPSGQTAILPALVKAEALLEPLYQSSTGGGFALVSVRV